jgi:hypothetical protein
MKKILVAIAVLVILVVLVGFLLPTTYRIEERVTIQATPEAIHVHVGDLKKWEAWAPWIEEDPSIVVTYGETFAGIGASQTWTSENGDGELTITRSDPVTGIAYDMAFIMEEKRAPAVCTMDYETNGNATDVVWTMEGDVGDFMPPVIAGYMNAVMKGSIGAMFVKGLETLKATVEG